MARILDPQPGMTVYDPCCGSAGLLIKCHPRLLETHGKPNMTMTVEQATELVGRIIDILKRSEL